MPDGSGRVTQDELKDFWRWALTDLALNINRGSFAEWLVGKALGVMASNSYRIGWASYDLDYEGHKIEVKSSARGQSWPQIRPSAVSWGIAPSQWRWDDPLSGDDEGSWTRLDPPQRVADVYVFCCYKPYPLPDGRDGLDERNSGVTNLENWRFWVAKRETLDERFGTNKSVTLGQINDSEAVAGPMRWSDIPTAVDTALASARERRPQGDAPQPPGLGTD